MMTTFRLTTEDKRLMGLLQETDDIFHGLGEDESDSKDQNSKDARKGRRWNRSGRVGHWDFYQWASAYVTTAAPLMDNRSIELACRRIGIPPLAAAVCLAVIEKRAKPSDFGKETQRFQNMVRAFSNRYFRKVTRGSRDSMYRRHALELTRLRRIMSKGKWGSERKSRTQSDDYMGEQWQVYGDGLMQLLSYCDQRTLVAMRGVSRAFYNHSMFNQIWKPRVMSDFPYEQKLELTDKEKLQPKFWYHRYMANAMANAVCVRVNFAPSNLNESKMPMAAEKADGRAFPQAGINDINAGRLTLTSNYRPNFTGFSLDHGFSQSHTHLTRDRRQQWGRVNHRRPGVSSLSPWLASLIHLMPAKVSGKSYTNKTAGFTYSTQATGKCGSYAMTVPPGQYRVVIVAGDMMYENHQRVLVNGEICRPMPARLAHTDGKIGIGFYEARVQTTKKSPFIIVSHHMGNRPSSKKQCLRLVAMTVVDVRLMLRSASSEVLAFKARHRFLRHLVAEQRMQVAELEEAAAAVDLKVQAAYDASLKMSSFPRLHAEHRKRRLATQLESTLAGIQPQISEYQQVRRDFDGEIRTAEQSMGSKWACNACTFHNQGSANNCEMCNTAKPSKPTMIYAKLKVNLVRRLKGLKELRASAEAKLRELEGMRQEAQRRHREQVADVDAWVTTMSGRYGKEYKELLVERGQMREQVDSKKAFVSKLLKWMSNSPAIEAEGKRNNIVIVRDFPGKASDYKMETFVPELGKNINPGFEHVAQRARGRTTRTSNRRRRF